MRRGLAEAVRLVGVKFIDHAHIRVAREQDEHGLRTRRSYEEIEGTEGFAIIQSAGLKPFNRVTPAQQQIIAGRERQAEQERADRERFETEIAGVSAVRGGPLRE